MGGIHKSYQIRYPKIFIFRVDFFMFFHTMTTKMKQMFDDYINGNLAAAKRRAKRYKFGKVYAAAQEIFSEKKAIAVTLYLKEPSQETFQKACDAD